MAEHELLVVVTTPEGKVYNHRSYSVSADTASCSNHASFKNRGTSSETILRGFAN